MFNKILQLNNLKTRRAMNVEVLVFVICDEAIIYLVLYNLHDCAFESLKKRNSQKRYK